MKGSIYHRHITATYGWARPAPRDRYRRFAINAYGMEPEEYASALHTRNMYVLGRDDHTCRSCGSEKGLTVVNVSGSEQYALEPRNCMTLCFRCARRAAA